jgi:hypothetical protein
MSGGCTYVYPEAGCDRGEWEEWEEEGFVQTCFISLTRSVSLVEREC